MRIKPNKFGFKNRPTSQGTRKSKKKEKKLVLPKNSIIDYNPIIDPWIDPDRSESKIDWSKINFLNSFFFFKWVYIVYCWKNIN